MSALCFDQGIANEEEAVAFIQALHAANKLFHFDDSRLLSAWFGPGEQLKAEAFRRALELS